MTPMRAYISLGFSCQTRISLDAVFADPRRHPFDFVVATRAAVLGALSSYGAIFTHAVATSEIQVMTEERRHGVGSRGIHYWHDYPVAPDGHIDRARPSHVGGVNEKYRFLWARTQKLLDDPSRPKTFVCGNTQYNLPEFTSGLTDFQAKFGLDLDFATDLRRVLRDTTAGPHSVRFLNRDIGHSHAFACLGRDAPARNRFWGAVGGATNAFLAASALLDRLSSGESRASLAMIEGDYANGGLIRRVSDDAAYVYRVRDGVLDPWAEVSALEDGYLFAFAGGQDLFLTAAWDGEVLAFSNNTRWRKAPAQTIPAWCRDRSRSPSAIIETPKITA